MPRYRYVEAFSPPAPFAHVTVRARDGAAEVPDLPAQLDCGASRTVVPVSVVKSLNIQSLGIVDIEGVGGIALRVPTFDVILELRLLVPLAVKVVAHDAEPFVLLGRDVLNQFRILLDGPNQALEID